MLSHIYIYINQHEIGRLMTQHAVPRSTAVQVNSNLNGPVVSNSIPGKPFHSSLPLSAQFMVWIRSTESLLFMVARATVVGPGVSKQISDRQCAGRLELAQLQAGDRRLEGPQGRSAQQRTLLVSACLSCDIEHSTVMIPVAPYSASADDDCAACRNISAA
jgi:hypothetical protein